MSKLGSAHAWVLVTVLGIYSSHVSFAASHTWSGATSGVWSVAGNWSAGGAPVNAEAAVALVFPNAQMNMDVMVNDLTGLNVTSITFSDTAYAVTGNAINLNGIISIDNGSNGANASIGFDMALTGTGVFQLSGTTSLGLTFSGVISGAQNVVVQNTPVVGTPNARFMGANTYTGTTTVQSGYLYVSNASALGAGDGTAATGTVVNGNGSLVLQGVTVANEALTIGGSGQSGNGALQSAGASPNTWQGPITLTSAGTVVSAIGGNPTITFSGMVGESAQGSSFAFRTAAVATLTAANSYTGTDTIEYGTVVYNGPSQGSISVNGGSAPSPTLAGNGNFATITVGGGTNDVLDPGAPGGGIGSITASTVNFTGATATYRVQIASTASYDFLFGQDTTIGAGTLLDVTAAPVSVGDAFTIIGSDGGPVTGTFAGHPNNSFFLSNDGQPFQITYNPSDVTLTRVMALPVELQTFEIE